MKRTLTLALTVLAAPAVAHDAGGVFHLHPHGAEAIMVGLALAAGVAIWVLRRR